VRALWLAIAGVMLVTSMASAKSDPVEIRVHDETLAKGSSTGSRPALPAA
jgi:hypothetical protein